MPTLFRVGPFRIVVYFNDHPPPHVHAIGEGHATFTLGRASRDVALEKNHGIVKSDLRRIAKEIGMRHDEIAGWTRQQNARSRSRSKR